MEELKAIAGQKPVTRAKKSIASFKLRQGMPIGVMVTLRGEQMYEPLIAWCRLPYRASRFSRRLPKRSMGAAITIGIREQLIFPEIDFNKVDKLRGMNMRL